MMQRYDHNAPSHFQRPDRVTDPLYVVSVIFNPIRFRSRWKLYQDFAKRVAESGAVLFTVEAAFGQREFAIADGSNCDNTLGVRVSHELWLKENLVNLGVQRLPADWKYVAWVDADVAFARDDWADETTHQLQHHPVVQMWSHSLDLGPDHTPLDQAKSFAWCHVNHETRPIPGDYYYYGGVKGRRGLWHPGYAWAMRRDAYDQVGGLIDFSIVGNGDNQMANGIVGTMKGAVVPSLHGSPYYRDLMLWQERAEKYLRHDLGYVDGLLLHYWHGKKKQRQYKSRWQILVDAQFNPRLDLKRDWQGAWQLTDRSEILRDGLRQFGRARNEDSVDT